MSGMEASTFPVLTIKVNQQLEELHSLLAVTDAGPNLPNLFQHTICTPTHDYTDTHTYTHIVD